MIERELMVLNLSPLALHADRSRLRFIPGLDYIPGSALRGAVASLYLQTYGEDDLFQAIFLAEQVLFADLLPAEEDSPGILLPATARLCKHYRWEHKESLTDALLRLALAAEMESPEPLEDEAWKFCPEADCQGVTKRDRIYGYIAPSFEQIQVTKRLISGTAINRATGTAESGMLFSQEVLEEGQSFRGVIRFRGDDAETLSERLEELLQPGKQLWLGAARSRGFGLVEVKGWGEPLNGVSLESRWTLFNEAVKELWRRYGAKPNGDYFSLTLESHLLLRDELCRPLARWKDYPNLPKALGLEGVTLKRHVILPAIVRGWNALQGLPKEDEFAIGRGSVFLFRVEPGYEEETQKRLAVIEKEGLGRRRGEGFGRIRVCDPFHYYFVLKEVS